ncbi:putative [ribosomal protein S18]-alanine N-acetyltransferase [Mangifera indica]|uniref:putative [ribosomal protein S18]-alanine N-acetyltransferase n=1 Tax=Mangifera indica TaxID=29780 RepID=UPI001CFAA9BC|nr:putative [ribosomal protein S18]-alanine N-acetyltransferase [Mangifera indica]
MSKLGKRRASATSQETGGTSGSEGIMELQRNSTQWRKVVEEIVKLEKKIFPKHESLARSFDDELKKRNSGLLYLEVDEQVVGYVMYSWPSSLFASITKLAVKESWRRRGHGEELLKAAIEKCRSRNVSRIMLHVDTLRTPALNLYKKFGFQIDSLIQGYYSPDRHAYRMYLDFDSN